MEDKEVMKAFLEAILGEKEKPVIDGEKLRKQGEDIGNTLFHIYLGFIDAGWNEEQAFKLLTTVIGGNK